MENRDFIITSLQPWDIKIGSTIKSTALEISKNNRVLFINTPITCVDLIKTKGKRKEEICQVAPNLWIAYFSFAVFPLNKIPSKYLFDTINRINNKKIAKGILHAIKELGFNDYIHLIDTDIYRSQYLKDLIHPKLSIYYCRDYVIGADYWKKNGSRLEASLAAKSDIVLANSSTFAERLIPFNPNTHTIETGVDLQLYDFEKNNDKPSDLIDIPRPIVGYTGMVITLRLDIKLIFQVASSRPNISFVFIGPTDDNFKQHPIQQLPNVYFKGRKEISQLPAYIKTFDICFNPQQVNDITIGNYPLKIDEYLAMGKPVVATRTRTMQEVFGRHVFLGSNADEYLQAIDLALFEKDDKSKQQARIAFARTHSWTNSVNKIYQAIKETEAAK